jgi:cardiolipin synthase
VVGHIGWNDHNVKAMFLRAVGTAQKSIRIANPYFTDEDIFASLCAAVRRGVRVQIILPQNNDEKLVQRASRDAYPELLKAGVEIYEYKDRMAHEKVEVIDGRWATFGSSNLDARSLTFNDELNLVVTDTGVAGDIEKRLFDVDLLNSERILKYSPPIKDHLVHQLRSWL